MGAKLVSIIIPTFNRADEVVEAVRSALGQTYPSTQVIVVDDGSDDDTVERVSRIPGVEVYRQEHQGQAAARNLGLSKARGEYIASLDSDDLWDPDFLERSVGCLERLGLDFVFSNYRRIKDGEILPSDLDRSGELTETLGTRDGEWIVLDPARARRLFLKLCPAPSSSLLLTREAVARGWDERVLIADDWFLAVEALVERPRRVAFTLVPRWTKRTDGINIYDGRSMLENVRRLDVHDGALMLETFGPRLTRGERGMLARRLAFARFYLAYVRWRTGGSVRDVAGPAAAWFSRDPVGAARFLGPQFSGRVRRFLGAGAPGRTAARTKQTEQLESVVDER